MKLPRLTGSIPLEASIGDKYPKAKGDLRQRITLLFAPISTLRISASTSSFRSPAWSCRKVWTYSFNWLAMARAL